MCMPPVPLFVSAIKTGGSGLHVVAEVGPIGKHCIANPGFTELISIVEKISLVAAMVDVAILDHLRVPAIH